MDLSKSSLKITFCDEKCALISWFIVVVDSTCYVVCVSKNMTFGM